LRNVAVIRPVMLRDILTGRLVPTVPVKRRIPHSQYYSRWQQGFSGSRRTDSTGARRLTSRKGEKQRLAKEGKEDDGSLGEGLAMAEEHANALYYGDNLEILRRYIKDAFPASSSHVKDATPSAASSTACCIACKAARSKRLYGGTASPPIYAADASRCLLGGSGCPGTSRAPRRGSGQRGRSSHALRRACRVHNSVDPEPDEHQSN